MANVGDLEKLIEQALNGKTVEPWDSLGSVLVICAVEEHYGITIPTTVWPRLRSLAELCSYLQEFVV